MGRLTKTLALCLSIGPFAALAQTVTLDASDADGDLQTALSAASLSLSLSRDGATSSQDYIAAARADYRRLLTGLYSQGYYGGTISILVDGVEASNLDPLAPRASVNTVTLSVTPGPQFTFGRTDIAPLAPGTTLPEAFGTGQVAQSATVAVASQAAVTGWRDVGHPLAIPSGQQISADHPAEQLNVTVEISPGPKLTFGQITVDGNDAVRTERILAIAGIPLDATFDPELIERAETNLRRTGAFRSATVIEADSPSGTTLPLTLSIVEQAPRRVGAGVEFSSVTGLTLSGFWMHRNLLGGAERFRVDGEITGLSGGTGGIDYSLGATFLRPATFRQDTDFYSNFLVEQLDEPAFFQRDISAEAGIIRRLRSGAVLEYGIGFAAGEISDDLGDRSYGLLYLPLSGTLDRRNDPFNATDGFYAALDVSPFAGFNQTDSGVRVFGDGRYFQSFGVDDRITFAARAQFGAVFGADAGNVPSDYLFFSGGGGTVRGQPYQSLAIDLGGGLETGGTSFFGTQLEARVNVTDTIGVVGFYDAGLISATQSPFSDAEFHAGAGLGLRYNTGIGPIRLDLATPTTGDSAGRSLEVYIGIGQAF